MIRRLAVFAFVSTLFGNAAAMDISSCNVTVPPGEVGVIQTDLSCMGAFVVALERGATLDLNGHLISLDVNPASSQAVVQCNTRRCAVAGPGSLRCHQGPGNYSTGVGMPKGGRLDVTDTNILFCDQGIWDMGSPGAKTRVYATDLRVLYSTYNGIEAEKLVATNLETHDNGFSGLAVEQVRGTNLVVNYNGDDGGHSGITSFGGVVRVTGLVAKGNARHGVEAKKVILDSSTVTDNDVVDIVSVRFPRLINVVCGTSNWGVCAND